MIRKYNTKNCGVEFRLKFNTQITIIDGDSGIGKTVLFKALERDSLLKKINAVCLNYDDVTSGIIDITLRSKDSRLIVIDNADTILTDKDKLSIALNNTAQFIIFAHSIEGFPTSNQGIAELVVKNNKGKLVYPLMT